MPDWAEVSLPVDCLARVGFDIRLADTVDPSAILNFKDLMYVGLSQAQVTPRAEELHQILTASYFPSFSFVSSPEMEVCLRLGFYLPADNFAFNPALTESIYPASFVISRKEGQVLSLNLSMLFPRLFSWLFSVAYGLYAILGADVHTAFLVACQDCRLYGKLTTLTVQIVPSSEAELSVCVTRALKKTFGSSLYCVPTVFLSSRIGIYCTYCPCCLEIASCTRDKRTVSVMYVRSGLSADWPPLSL
ncbi:unnamed protein product [Schistocephalus solidus]|uniref:Triplex capsid protein 1 n=1 Tax=Schistocephalus solidus TaxID=70667 RepID=A0A183SBK7_SCHSO|nr:unnamed protein product [Schistocephalus solidus]